MLTHDELLWSWVQVVDDDHHYGGRRVHLDTRPPVSVVVCHVDTRRQYCGRVQHVVHDK